MALPETASTALVTRTVTLVNVGKPEPLGVKVIRSRAADQVKVPLTAGVVTKEFCTLLVSIVLLNRSTMDEAVGALVESCGGELLTTTGSSGCQSDCATKIFAEVPGI